MEANQNRAKSLSNTINVMFVIGYIIDFCFRKEVLPQSLDMLALAPFIINIGLIAYSIILVVPLKKDAEKNKRTAQLIIQSVLNVAFITMIILL